MSKRFEQTRGRRMNGPFLPLPRDVLESEQFAALPDYAVRLIAALGSQYNGRNSGDQSAAWTLMQHRGFRTKSTLHKAIRALLESGFVTVTRQGSKRRCSLYGFTWLPIHECADKLDVQPTKIASHLWKECQPLPRHWSPPKRTRKNGSGDSPHEPTASPRESKRRGATHA